MIRLYDCATAPSPRRARILIAEQCAPAEQHPHLQRRRAAMAP
jgi:hypothetical protein